MPKNNKTNKGIVLIKKSNNLIESRYGFDIWETRFFLSILSQIRREDEEFKVYRIWYRDVIKTFGLKSGDSYALLRDAAQSLMGKSFFVSYEEGGVVREKQYHILREIDYLKEGQETHATQNHEYLDVTIEQRMKPLLLQLQRNFTAYDLQNIVKLGVYPIRVYELLKQYQNIGSRTLGVEEMKVMFELADKYRLFGDFYRWIVQPAIKQINKHTDLTITNTTKIKEGRKVIALRFAFEVKNTMGIQEAHNGDTEHTPTDSAKGGVGEGNAPQNAPQGLFRDFEGVVVGSFGVTPSKFSKMLATGKYGASNIQQAINVTRRAKFQQEISKNIAGFFLKALEEGYTDPKEEARKQQQRHREKEAEKQRLNQEMDALAMEFDLCVHGKIRELTAMDGGIAQRAIDALKASQNPIIAMKGKHLGRELDIEDFRQDKTLRRLVKDKIMEMNEPHFSAILKDYEGRMKPLQERFKSI